MTEPRYTKAGRIYKADRDFLALGWPEFIEPGTTPEPGRKNPLKDPNPRKRKGQI